MMVIGAGQGRSGTESLKLALNTLGVGPTYHMSQLLGVDATMHRPVNPLEMLGLSAGHADSWIAVEDQVDAQQEVVDFDFLTQHYQSTLDYPSAAYFAELLQAHPDAKVILTVRDPNQVQASSRDTWCKLIGATESPLDRVVSWLYSLRPYGRRFFKMHDAMGKGTARALGEDDFQWKRVCLEEDYGTELFQKWNDHVIQTVPPEQLLVFATGTHGYAELVDFLGVDDPDGSFRTADYPRTNSREEFGFVLRIQRVLAVLQCVVVLAVCRRWLIPSKGSNADTDTNTKEKKTL